MTNDETARERLKTLATRDLRIALNQADCMKPECRAAYDAELATRENEDRPIKNPPKNIQEGTANHVRMIINQLEAGDSREALMLALDLLDQLVGSRPHLRVTIRRGGGYQE